MSARAPVALILGAGSNVGDHVGRAFAAKGYKVALAARSVKEQDSTSDKQFIRGDFADPESIASIFTKVKSQLGVPHVVIYNAAASNFPGAKTPLNVPVNDFVRNLAINTTSAFVAAQQAALGFEELPDSAARTFIYTGNCTNETPMAALSDASLGKAASASFIQAAAGAYADKGFKFYYADERKADGSPAFSAIDGPAHGEFYTQLAEGASQGPWQQTFVKGQGYAKF
ncbi:hypothetical protein ACHAQD_009744 [Fusarium lateritium]